MFKNIVPLVLALFVTCSLWAQTPREIVVIPAKSGSRSSMMCELQDAGNISFAGADPDNQSNDARTLSTTNPIFLCWGDKFTIQHDQASANFVGGDPMRRGVGYAFYECPPTVPGLTLRNVLDDPCTLRSLTDPSKPLVFVAGKTTGRSVFRNEQNTGTLSLQQLYNNGDPVQYYFTPITYDNYNNDDEAIYEDGDDSCVNSDTSQTFSVVYLNPIELVDVNTSACGGELRITGGLPEFNQSNYTVDIVNEDDPTITGILNGNARHDEAISFTVSAVGDYVISITDNKACTTTERRINISVCDAAEAFTLEAADVDNIFVGDQFCLDFDVSNFDNIVSMEFRVDWDSTILDFESVSVDPGLSDPSLSTNIDFTPTFLSFTENGKLKLGGWVTTNFNDGSSLPDNTTLFTICFVAKAEGDPNFRIEDNPADNNLIEIVDINSDPVAFSSSIAPNTTVASRPPDGEIIIQTNVTAPCRGQDNGKLALSFVGGIPPYSLDLSGATGYSENFRIFGQDTIIENLAVDDYAFLVRDEGNTAQGTSQIGNPVTISDFVLNIRFDEDDPSCVGENSGSLTARPLIFNTPADNPEEYTYQWSTSPNDTLQVLDSLIAGTYSVTITDLNGCSAVDDEDLFDPEDLRIGRIEVDPAQCSGTFDGSLTVNVTGGTGPKTFSWDTDPEIINSTNNVLSDLDVGDYNLTVTDTNGCTVTTTSKVTGAVEISADPMATIVTDVQCFNAGNGAITFAPRITTEPGTPPVSVLNTDYQWSPNATDVISNAVSSQVSNLSPGTYVVTITNSDVDAQCFGTSTFEIEEPDSLMLAIDITNVTQCQMTNPDGSAIVTASGGNGDYSYVWSEIGGGTSGGNTAMRLDADSITVSVSDDKGCLTTLDTVIGSPVPPVILQFENDDVSCATDRGSLQVLAGPGDARVIDNMYEWSGPSPVSSTRSLVGNLEVGKYFVTVIDENNCFSVDSAEVTAPPAFDYSNFVITAEPCFADSNGAFVLEFTGGTPVYDYAWEFEGEEISNNSTSITNAAAGDYRLRGTDGNDCPIDTTITLTSLPEIRVEFIDLVRTSCALSDTPDGGATAIARYADGTPGTFDFFWASTEEDSIATQLSSGNQSLLVSDNLCNVKAEVFIDSPAEISYDPTNEIITNVSCFGLNDGAISTISAASGGTPGTAGYTFEWTQVSNGAENTGESITDLSAGDYTLVISDENGCLSSPITKTITQPEQLAVVIDTDPNNTNDVRCAGDNDGKITVIATGGNDDLGPYTYEWTNNVSVEAVATDLAPDTYEIIVSDAKGCEATVERFIDEPADLNPYNSTFDPIQCFGEFTNIRLDPASFSGGNGGDYTYTVDGCPEKDVGEPSCQVRGGAIPITVFDSGGCAYDDIIDIPEPDQIVIEFPMAEMDGPNFVTEVQLGGQLELNAEIFNDLSVPIASVIWTDTSVVCPPLGDCRNGIVSPLNDTPYTIEVIDQNGCEESATIFVEVDKNRNVFIPNAFAPNSRGFDLNEAFKIYTGLGVRTINFAQVFNRWGTMVADIGTINDPSPSGITVWNGQLQGQKLAQGVYVYIVSVTFEDNVTLLYRGDVTLLR